MNKVRSQRPEAFADAHAARLQNTSFTIGYSRVRIKNGTIVFRTTGTVQYDENGTVYHNYTKVNNETGSPTREHIEVWSNRTTAHRARTTANGTTVEKRSPIGTAPTFGERVKVYLRLFETKTSGYSRIGDKPTLRLSGSTLDRDGPWLTTIKQVYGFVSIDSGQFSADATETMLRRYHVRLVGRGAPLAPAVTVVTVEAVFTRLGVTTVRRPTWVTGRNETRAGTSAR